MSSVKKPKKGILKTSSSFDAEQANPRNKEMKWDEMNIMATHHPPDKDYGHMKIDEPPTPYSKYSDPEDDEESSEGRRASIGKASDMDPSSLSSKLADIEGEKGPRLRRVSTEDEESSEEEEELTEEEKEVKRRFEQKRKLHYNEFQAVKLAKQLMAEEDEDEEDEEDDDDKEKGAKNDNDEDVDDNDSEKLTQDSVQMQTDENENPEVCTQSSESTDSTTATEASHLSEPRETLIN